MENSKVKELERRAVRFVLEKGKKIKEGISSFVGPKAPQTGAGDLPLEVMSRRQDQLKDMGGKNTGGMFDIIYKKRKEREEALKGID